MKRGLAPGRLPEKLVAIRRALGLTQNELLDRLKVELLTNKDISRYERGRTHPPPLVVLRYARIAGVNTDVLIDDELDLPKGLPGRER